MQLILNNPYRITGLLIGVTAKEQDRQIRRLKQFIEAEQEPQDDFSFPTLGNLHRTLESVEEAASKLNLDRDKINAALFWFWNGNPITDEPAFDAIKECDLDSVLNIWSKLTANGEVSRRNASAYHNLGTFYLSGALDGTDTNENILEQGISLKLKFLESSFVKDFKALATDETYKTTKKELQLLFLNQLQTEVETKKKVSSGKFLEILNKQEFAAKQDFLKGFVQKPIGQIEQKIETAKNKRKANKANAAKAGQELYRATTNALTQLKNIISISDIKYSSVADKVANEMLQCSIDYFNYSQEKDSNADYAETALTLAKKAETVAVGNIIKDRIKDSINTLEGMKDREISEAIAVLKSIKNAYDSAYNEIIKMAKKQLGIYEEEEFMEIGGIKVSMPRKLSNPYNTKTINYSAVEEAAKKSINWDKAIELVQQAIPSKNIYKIRSEKNPTKLNEYKNLVNFLMSKLSQLQKNKIRYISFWETGSPITEPPRPISPPSKKSSNNWSLWGIGIGAVIGLIVIGADGLFAGALIGGIIASQIK